jgi:hypothetical protein
MKKIFPPGQIAEFEKENNISDKRNIEKFGVKDIR